MKKLNVLWRFFASVKLALFTIFLLAGTSIIGTVVQQGQAPAHYVEEYGETLARVFQLLDIPTMYSSWWFITLLTLFAVNLIVCSIERLPASWRMVTHESRAPDYERLEKMNSKHRADTALPTGIVATRMQELLSAAGWRKSTRLERDGSTVLFAQQGAWTRFGAHIVHLSILVIFAGVLIGNLFGFKAYVFLPEMRATTNIFLQSNREPVPLDFELYYERFEMALYPDGSIREYRSELTVYDPQRAQPYEKTSIVNDPLRYNGIAFYIADNYPLEEYFITIQNRTTGEKQSFRVPPDYLVTWPETEISFSIEELRQNQEGATQQAKISFSDGSGSDPSVFWMNNKGTVTIKGPGDEFTFSFHQLYTTLFLANKDPGVMVVYAGFFLMVIGLCISFFLSHQRIWVYIAPKEQGSRILVSGLSNKHQPAFERRFQELIARIKQDEPIVTTVPKAAKPLKKRRAAA